ncbi:hypothetical protein NM208_g9231 [Fusarium decemcellulare]|uniref:Uncharacterized protein n=1 Tax=Fusarium decemcellulare TaxID=57161 RepID=A0ACC1S2C3_9HYPO|nr:hypothetical protein NM208_g9231 [Fusarium decemcellulare]
MSSEKLIVVLGATGNQGGSVVDTFLAEPGWKVRGITRNKDSVKAKSLEHRGVEVVEADMDQPATLVPAFQDTHVIFAVSDFWGMYGDPENQDKPAPGQSLGAWVSEKEAKQLRSVIDAGAEVPTLERFVFSSLSNATKWSKGKYTQVYHFDAKAQAEEYGARNHPEFWAKTSIFQAGYFLSNFVSNSLTRPIKNSTGVIQFIGNLDPDLKLPFIAAEEDSGPLVKALVNDDPGRNLITYREWLTFRELAQAFTQATGVKAEVVQLPKGEFMSPLPEELKSILEENWAYWNEYGYEARDDPTVIHPRDLKSPPELDSVINYLRKQDWEKVWTS